MVARGVVVIGGGQAGFQVAATLRRNGFAEPIRIVAEEPGLPYQRPPLSKGCLIDGDPTQFDFRPAEFFQHNTIELLADEVVTAINRTERTVELRSGWRLIYDELVLATGSTNRQLEIPGRELVGVCGLRTRNEARALRAYLSDAGSLVIVGAGLIGLEVAATAARQGLRVRIIEAAWRAMARTVSPEVADFCCAELRSAGVLFDFGEKPVRFLGRNGRVVGVELASGMVRDADVVLVAVGVEPRSQLAAAAGLAARNGILVNDTLGTTDTRVSAIGDCAAFPSRRYGTVVRMESVQNASDQGSVLATRLVGRGEPYDRLPLFWSDQGRHSIRIAGLKVGEVDRIVRRSTRDDSFSVFCFSGSRLISVESVNHPSEHMAAKRILERGIALKREQAADANFDLDALARQAPKGATVDHGKL
jgi:3-phenylpropionate/trans-cinnamate dioxygenase ferredoxin reductase subunit